METYNKAQEYSVKAIEDIYNKYGYLSKDEQSLLNFIPIGWLSELEKCLETLSKTGLQLKIKGFGLRGRGFEVDVEYSESEDEGDNSSKYVKKFHSERSAHYVLHALLNHIDNLCVLCDEGTDKFGLCKACMEDRDNTYNTFKG